MYIWVKSCVNYLKLIGDDEDNGFVIVRILFSSKKVDIFEKLLDFHQFNSIEENVRAVPQVRRGREAFEVLIANCKKNVNS